MANQDFEDLSRSILDEILSWDPSFATQLGWQRYDHDVMDPRGPAFERQCARLSHFVRELEEIDAGVLSDDQVIDRDLATYLFKLRIFEISRLRIHEQMSIAEDEIGRSLFFLFVRNHDSFETRADAIISRLEKTPEFLARARSILVTPCRPWNEIALETGERLPAFLNVIRETGTSKLDDDDKIARLGSAVEDAIDAIQSYEDWLRNDIMPRSEPSGRITRKDFEDYIRLKGFGLSPEEAITIAELSIAAANEQRRLLAADIAPSGHLKDALRRMKDAHPPTFEGVIKSYREWIARSRDFVIDKQLATIPDDERLLVLETPYFMRHLSPFASQYEPGKYGNDTKGLFLVTPDDGNEELLRDHCYAAIANTAVHEGYPGHHLQGICSNLNPSHIRALSTAPSFAEGWALYCERMMISEGFENNPLGKLAQLNDLVFRIVRVIAEVGLVEGTMTTEDVADMLVSQTGMERNAALNEAESYSYQTTYPLSYFIGMLQVLQLREDVEKALGDKFSLKDFHDSLLNAGCLPIQHLRMVERDRLKREFGVALQKSEESLLDYARRLVTRANPF